MRDGQDTSATDCTLSVSVSVSSFCRQAVFRLSNVVKRVRIRRARILCAALGKCLVGAKAMLCNAATADADANFGLFYTVPVVFFFISLFCLLLRLGLGLGFGLLLFALFVVPLPPPICPPSPPSMAFVCRRPPPTLTVVSCRVAPPQQYTTTSTINSISRSCGNSPPCFWCIL